MAKLRKMLTTKNLLWKVLWLYKRRKNRDIPVSPEEQAKRNEDEPIE